VAIRTRDYRTIERYADVARLLTGDQKAPIDDGVNHVTHLCSRLKIPRLRDFSIATTDFPEIAEKAASSSSMKGNAVPLDHSQLIEVLEVAW
jgi:alcohol dehydrogenase class IV